MQFINTITGQISVPAPWQIKLKINDYYVVEKPFLSIGKEIYSDLPCIYGQIISDEGCSPGYFYSRAFSRMYPEGEIGLMNICEPSRNIPEWEFLYAKELDWPPHYLRWFSDSPDIGPDCACSYCEQPITISPVCRFFSSQNTELRFHLDCLKKGILK